MSLCGDSGGLESLPLKLVIVAIVAALSVLPAADALETLKDRDLLQRADSQIHRIASAAESLAITGPGNVRSLSIDLTAGGNLRVSKVVMGDREDGPNASAIVLEFSSGARMVRVLHDPHVCMTSSSGSALEITDPKFDLRMSSKASENGWYVLVEAG